MLGFSVSGEKYVTETVVNKVILSAKLQSFILKLINIIMKVNLYEYLLFGTILSS